MITTYVKRLSVLLTLLLFATLSLSAAIPAGYELIASSGKGASLLYDRQRNDVVLMNDRTGYLWRSIISEQELLSSELGSQWETRVQSLFEYNYSIPSDENIYFGSEQTSECTITEQRISDGLVLHIDLTEVSIRFDMVFTLTESGMQLTIPFDSLEEYGQNSLVSLSPLPFFGIAGDAVDGYAFYPDGSGAIHTFSEDHPEYLTEYRAMVYNRPILDVDTDVYTGEPVLIPLFGMKHGTDGFAAFATEGDADMNIFFSPSGYRIDYNRIGSEFVYRHRYNIKRSNVVSKSTQALNTVVEIIDDRIIEGDRVLSYQLLSGGQASYSGMAGAYRGYLRENGKLSDHISASDEIPVGITTLLGIKEERILLDRYIPMTTFEDLDTMIEELEALGTGPLSFDLIGWEKDGYRADPVTIPIPGKLGGRKGLYELVEGHPEHEFIIVLNDMRARNSSGGFSVYDDVLKNPLGLVITDGMNNVYIISPSEAQKRLEKRILPYFREGSISGIRFTGLGDILLMDTYDGKRVMRSDTLKRSLEMVEAVNSAYGDCGISSGNGYLLGSVSSLSDIPMKDSGYFFTDRAVPVYQMIVHGSLPYTARPGNLHWDLDEVKLKWVEYGYNPLFELTWLDAVELEDTSYSRLFNSSFSSWKQEIAGISNEFNSRLQHLYDRQMVEHRYITDTLVSVLYDDGSLVLVNHGREPVQYEGVTVDKRSYEVVLKESMR